MSLQFNLVRREDTANITVVVDGELFTADDEHPLFDEIVDAAVNGDESVVDLFDASHRAAAVFESITDRVTVANSRVYVDQTEVEDVFADQIVRFMNEGRDDFMPLVRFLEKVYSNVSEGIRENLSRWLNAEQFTITEDGNILGYRGLNADYTSKHAGPGIVNGEQVHGHLDNSVGNTVELPVDLVEENAHKGCASGLHVGTYNYASGWAGPGGVVVSVSVDPRHVRSVPYECASEKMRVSKYVVTSTITSKVTDSVYSASGYDFFDDDDFDEYDDEDEGFIF